MTDLSSLIDLTNKIFFKVIYQFPGIGFSETDSFHFLLSSVWSWTPIHLMQEVQARQKGCV